MATLSIPLSGVALLLTEPLSHVVDGLTLVLLRAALNTNFAQHFDRHIRCQDIFELRGSVMPPKPILKAGFTVRILWSTWFNALSPSGRAILLKVVDDRASRHPASAFGDEERPQLHSRTPTPIPSLTLTSSCIAVSSDAAVHITTSSDTSAAHTLLRSSSESQFVFSSSGRELPDAVQHRRPRRKRGGVKQRQRGIHVDKTRLDPTPYVHAGGSVTGVLTGGVMLGRRACRVISASAEAGLFLFGDSEQTP
ncbi:hypothetical protein EXIGLDRAFT_816746 [Exidia glandulosa HHB12029]|uniref:Uncharacterized protein n=1 Tax=Exidia glandulosa HHB12029 TaxID=1314781 RepID=A0A165KKF5_EXIGL|nr:hypothetical protein EXIGLDRAFT_816746 [Exidia glandulosa HHB12029]